MSITNKQRNFTCFNFSKSRQNRCLVNIKQRCNNPNNPYYKWYGAKGIKCFITLKEINKLFIRDKAWLLKTPSIDRINNDGYYTYENCRFIELSENLRKSNIERKK